MYPTSEIYGFTSVMHAAVQAARSENIDHHILDSSVTQAFYIHGTVLYELGEYLNALKFLESAPATLTE